VTSTPEERAELRRLALAVSAARQALEQGEDPYAAVAFDNASAALYAKLSPERVVGLIDAHERCQEELSFLRAQAGAVYEHFTGSDDTKLYSHQLIQQGERRIQWRIESVLNRRAKGEL